MAGLGAIQCGWWMASSKCLPRWHLPPRACRRWAGTSQDVLVPLPGLLAWREAESGQNLPISRPLTGLLGRRTACLHLQLAADPPWLLIRAGKTS